MLSWLYLKIMLRDWCQNMNNMRNLFRIEHMSIPTGPVHVGPYSYARKFKDSDKEFYSKIRDYDLPLPVFDKYLDKYRYRNVPIGHKLNRSSLPPASFIRNNVGIFEDPYLRDTVFNIWETIFVGFNLTFCFGCTNLQDLNKNWLYDSSYRETLRSREFVIRRYRCEIIHEGLRQSIAIFSGKIQPTNDLIEI